jgi:phosphate butyryltransferase
MKTFSELVEEARKIGPKKIVLVGADDKEGLKALKVAHSEKIVVGYLVGNKKNIENIAKEIDFDIKDFEIIDESDPAKASEIGVKLVSSKKADFLMKGLVKTAILLKAVLDKDWGLRTGEVLSHVAVEEVPGWDKFIFVTDGGMVVKPDLQQKASIAQNAINLAKSLGVSKPKVAVLSAVEVVNPSIPETLDAAMLAKMSDRGQIKDGIVDGPFALDNAVSEFAAKIKHVSGEVAGNADILLVPDLNSGNILGKSLVYFANAKIAGLIVGAKAPVVVISRADKDESKLYSIALGAVASV